jgi:hypothetical protein
MQKVIVLFCFAQTFSSVTGQDEKLKAGFPALLRDSLVVCDCHICFEKNCYVLPCEKGEHRHNLGCISCIRTWLCGFDDDEQLNSPECSVCKASLSSLQIELCTPKIKTETEEKGCENFAAILELIKLNRHSKQFSLAGKNLGAMTRKQVNQFCEIISKAESYRLDLSDNNFNQMDIDLRLKIKRSIPDNLEIIF